MPKINLTYKEMQMISEWKYEVDSEWSPDNIDYITLSNHIIEKIDSFKKFKKQNIKTPSKY
jgi:hypothetical protein